MTGQFKVWQFVSGSLPISTRTTRKFAGNAWRVGLMGENASIERADLISAALMSVMH